jgi:hypothetical protein
MAQTPATAYSRRHLIWQHRHHRREECVEEQQGEAPSARTTATLGASVTARTPSEPPTTPVSIHGRRMPCGDEVRSFILPKTDYPSDHAVGI